MRSAKSAQMPSPGRSILERALLDHTTGEKIPLTVLRNGERMTIDLELANCSKAWDVLGLELTEEPKSSFQKRASRYRGGMRVVEVRPNSPAAKEGIRIGDILVGMHGWETASLAGHRLHRDAPEPDRHRLDEVLRPPRQEHALRPPRHEGARRRPRHGHDRRTRPLVEKRPLLPASRIHYNGGMEAEFHRWLREHVPAHPNLPLGLSDDAALLKRSDAARTS